MNGAYQLLAIAALIFPVAVAIEHQLANSLEHAAHSPRVQAYITAKDNDR
ncbi:hypothetical protein ACM0AZ_25270 [Mycobacteroides abscessus subsp. massiliense]|nr:hypothetical protein [Mycobacteroides abscessus]MBN7567144.1 hypothetical protein [Mycobacteroides abscessus subsp. massiliense]SIJ95627.1 Uncharacterised protein [Mycobacteroides abscessus subsp. abscessus]SLC96377.1 Uncharacterised protein [Mycobacteroides abscessus subsp. massiliense]SLF13821.1 Uncharacterised protein [Mycobacteroides abscessus subsp. massiliense]SLF28089.1 Uncharacterised protein [Mycobacteroides abscessus subsp. massiliense]